ncbi:MAG: DUF72 domain-containing protein [Desulfurococcaceae archaeon]
MYIGCCGFPVARRKYYELFKVVELQNTFYELPSSEWAKNIREEAPSDFEFTVKAWQVITHPHTSPTWRKMKKKPPGNLENYGYLKPTRENIEAFEKTLEVSRILNSRIIVLQTPSSMPSTSETLVNIDRFFDEVRTLINRELIGWEIRGPLLNTQQLKKILEKHDVVHVVDVFRTKPLHKGSKNVFYIRLHGVGPGEVNYSYNYTDEDLEKLYSILLEEEFGESYVMFNNVKMLNNALRLKEIASRREAMKIL